MNKMYEKINMKELSFDAPCLTMTKLLLSHSCIKLQKAYSSFLSICLFETNCIILFLDSQAIHFQPMRKQHQQSKSSPSNSESQSSSSFSLYKSIDPPMPSNDSSVPSNDLSPNEFLDNFDVYSLYFEMKSPLLNFAQSSLQCTSLCPWCSNDFGLQFMTDSKRFSEFQVVAKLLPRPLLVAMVTLGDDRHLESFCKQMVDIIHNSKPILTFL